MVETALYVPLVTFQVSFLVRWIFCQSLFLIAHSVRFDVGFGYHIDAIFVAQLIPEVIIRIMAGAYGVKVELFHDLDILNHAFT